MQDANGSGSQAVTVPQGRIVAENRGKTRVRQCNRARPAILPVDVGPKPCFLHSALSVVSPVSRSPSVGIPGIMTLALPERKSR